MTAFFSLASPFREVACEGESSAELSGEASQRATSVFSADSRCGDASDSFDSPTALHNEFAQWDVDKAIFLDKFNAMFARSEYDMMIARRASLISLSTLPSPSASQHAEIGVDDDAVIDLVPRSPKHEPNAPERLFASPKRDAKQDAATATETAAVSLKRARSPTLDDDDDNDNDNDNDDIVAEAKAEAARKKQTRVSHKSRRLAVRVPHATRQSARDMEDLDRLYQLATKVLKSGLSPSQILAVCNIGHELPARVAEQIPFVLGRLLETDLFSNLVRRNGEATNQLLVRQATLWHNVWTFCLLAGDIVNAVPFEKLRERIKWRIEKAFHGPLTGAKKVGDWRVKEIRFTERY